MKPEEFKGTITTHRGEDIIACITPQNNFHILAWSYAEAARTLFKHLNEDGLFIDIGVHPICFLYRHSLELRFKQIVWDGRRLLGEDSHIKKMCSGSKAHQLQPLWNEIETIMESLWPDLPLPKEGELLREIVAWFHASDPGSYSFRYPFDGNQKINLTDFRYINLSILVEAMETSIQFLDGVAGATSEYLSTQQDAW